MNGSVEVQKGGAKKKNELETWRLRGLEHCDSDYTVGMANNGAGASAASRVILKYGWAKNTCKSGRERW